MTADRTFLWLAMAFYAAGGMLTIRRLRGGVALPALERVNHVVMLCGFLLQTAFLYVRGQNIGRCPLTNSFETTAFITWAAVLFYLFIGPAYRVSFLGAFTAPVVVAINLVALVALNDAPRAEPLARSAWVDFHAAIAILAYGAFALAFVASGMFLLQERQLKTRRLSASFLLLPSIEQLEVINFRLLIMGFVMLTAGMIGGVISYRIVGHWTTPKIVWAASVWVLYGAVVLGRSVLPLRGRRVALASMVSFVLMLVGFWGVNLLRP